MSGLYLDVRIFLPNGDVDEETAFFKRSEDNGFEIIAEKIEGEYKVTVSEAEPSMTQELFDMQAQESYNQDDEDEDEEEEATSGSTQTVE